MGECQIGLEVSPGLSPAPTPELEEPVADAAGMPLGSIVESIFQIYVLFFFPIK